MKKVDYWTRRSDDGRFEIRRSADGFGWFLVDLSKEKKDGDGFVGDFATPVDANEFLSHSLSLRRSS